MHPAAAILLPFVLWDMAVYVLRRRGDRSAERRAAVLRYFTEEDIRVGREQMLRLLNLFPWHRGLFYTVFALLLWGGGAAWLEAHLLSLTGHWAAALPLFVGALLLGWALVSLPLEIWGERILRRAGLSTTTAGTFVADQLKGLLLGLVLASALAYPVIGLLRALPSWWPLPAAGAIIGFTALLTWIAPWVIQPLFNRFRPLADVELADKIRELADKAGVPLRSVLVSDASRRSTMLNAYFAGLGSSRRVVLYDTLVQSCSEDEVLATVAHELGHCKQHHIARLFLLQSAVTGAGLLALALLLRSAEARAALGLSQAHGLPTLVAAPLLATLAARLFMPLAAMISRRYEWQADETALGLTNQPQALVTLMRRLVRRAKGDLLQHKVLHRLYASHPLPEERMAQAEALRASQT